MTSPTEISIKKYLDDFIFDVFLQNLRYYDSINYYMSKDDSDFQLTNKFFEICIYDGIINDEFTYDDIINEFGEDAIDSVMCYWDCIGNFDNFPFKKMIEKFVKKNKSNVLGKLIKLTWFLWEKEKIVWINGWGDSPPFDKMHEFIKTHSDIKGIASWYTQNELLCADTSSYILYNPCDTEEHLNEGYCQDKTSYLDLKKRIIPYLDKLSIDYIDLGNDIKIKFTGNISMPNFIESDLK